MSFIVRDPQYQRTAAAWRPVPRVVRHVMARVWAKLAPAAFSIVDQQASAHPENPRAAAALRLQRERASGGR
jgi:hypothetical protein